MIKKLELERLDNLYIQKVELEKTDTLPECWSDIKPGYHLWRRKADINVELSDVVILIHGFNSWPSVWADELAALILARDLKRKSLGVIIVDWQEGAKWSLPPFYVWTDYSRAVGNTRCLADITTRLLTQLL